MKVKRLLLHQRLLLVLFLVVVVFLCIYSFFGSFYLNHQQHYHPYNRSLPQPAATLLLTTVNLLHSKWETGPYHNWELFAADFEEMKQQLKIFVYSDVFNKNSPFANIFLPLENPFDHPKLGNYFSEHIFKVSLLQVPWLLLTLQKPISFTFPSPSTTSEMDPRFHSEEAISQFVAHYTAAISHRFSYLNASAGADHFYVCCHSIGRQAASKHPGLHNNAIQLTCSSSYFQRFFVSHKDVGLPQIWPRPPQLALNPPHARHRLVYFAGRVQNSQIRYELIDLWGNDTEMDIFNGNPSLAYQEGFQRSKYCLHVEGYEVNTARISDSIHYGCIPVIISNYY